MIEYSDLPDELANQRNRAPAGTPAGNLPDGSLRFNAGSIAIHALRVSSSSVSTPAADSSSPGTAPEKKVAHVDAQGNVVKPDQPNAVKLEQFVFDAIPLARNSIVYTTDRAEEFSPVKNAEGSDSPATCRRDQVRRAARWLRAAGVEVPQRADGEPDATLEVSPLYATSAAQLRTRQIPLALLVGVPWPISNSRL